MDYMRAVNILGLKDGHTREEAKKAFKDIARRKHPDNFLSEEEKLKAEIEFKEANAAYNFLYGVSKPFIEEIVLSDDLREIKEQYIDKIFDYCLMDKKSSVDSFMNFCKNFVADLIYNSTIVTFRVSRANSRLEINNIFLEYISFVEGLNKEVKKVFFLKMNFSNDEDDEFDYQMSLYQFWLSLENKAKEIMAKQILDKYAKKENYEILEEDIGLLVAKSLAKIEFWDLKEQKQIMEDLCLKIDQLFMTYEKATKKIGFLKDFIYSNYDRNKIKMVNNLYDCMSLSYVLSMSGLEKRDYDILVSFFKIVKDYESHVNCKELLGQIDQLDFLIRGFRVYFKINDADFYILVKYQNEYYMQSMKNKERKVVDIFSWDDSFLSLDEFLDQAEFVGMIVTKGLFNKLIVLYSLGNIQIVLKRNKIEVMFGKVESSGAVVDIEIYQNKEFVRNMVNDMVRDSLMREKNLVREKRK